VPERHFPVDTGGWAIHRVTSIFDIRTVVCNEGANLVETDKSLKQGMDRRLPRAERAYITVTQALHANIYVLVAYIRNRPVVHDEC